MNCKKCKKPKTNPKNRLCSACNSTKMKSHYDSMKAKVFKHYGEKCSCCGESEKMFLSIDHIGNDGNKEVWASGERVTGVHLYSRIVALGFPERYQTLCINCNFGKHVNGGFCPHNKVQ